MISPGLLAVVRCPECGSVLAQDTGIRCTGCGRLFPAGGYLDLRPKTAFEEQTKYLDEALHADARARPHVSADIGAGRVHRALRGHHQSFDRNATVVLVLEIRLHRNAREIVSIDEALLQRQQVIDGVVIVGCPRHVSAQKLFGKCGCCLFAERSNSALHRHSGRT